MINDDFDIRPAVPDDSPQIARIWIEGLQVSSGVSSPPTDDTIGSFQARIREPLGKSAIWVAVLDRNVVGWQGLQDFGATQIIRIAQSSTYVAREWHSRGVGRKLLQFAQRQAGERGIHIIIGWIKTDNRPSIALVHRLGWKYVGILPRNNDSEPELAYYAYAVPKDTAVADRIPRASRPLKANQRDRD
jgi:L-amino acid N-acyltransferase YncA